MNFNNYKNYSDNNSKNNDNSSKSAENNSDNNSYTSNILSNNYLQEKESLIKREKKYEEKTRPKTFLPLQIIIYFNTLYSAFYCVAVSILFLYKGLIFPYPANTLAPEIAAFIFFMIAQFIRIKYMSIGNKSQNVNSIIVSIFIAIPIIMCFVYLVKFQTYSLVFDLGLNIFSIGFILLEVIFGIMAILKIN